MGNMLVPSDSIIVSSNSTTATTTGNNNGSFVVVADLFSRTRTIPPSVVVDDDVDEGAWNVALLPMPDLVENNYNNNNKELLGEYYQHGFWFRTTTTTTTTTTKTRATGETTTTTNKPVIRIKAKKSCTTTTTTTTLQQQQDDDGYLYLYSSSESDQDNAVAEFQGVILDPSKIIQPGEDSEDGASYMGFTFVGPKLRHDSNMFTPTVDGTTTSDDDDDVAGTFQFCIEIGLVYDNNNNDDHHNKNTKKDEKKKEERGEANANARVVGYAQAMFTYQMTTTTDHRRVTLMEYTTIQKCSATRQPEQTGDDGGSRRDGNNKETRNSGMCVQTFKPNNGSNDHHTPSTTTRMNMRSSQKKKKKKKIERRHYYNSPSSSASSSSSRTNNLQPHLAPAARVATKKKQRQPTLTQRIRDLQTTASQQQKTVVVYEFPPTETSQFVHGICVLGASTAGATCTDTDVTYTEITSQKFGNGITLWGDRSYIVEGGVTSQDQCMGGIYLQPSKHKAIDEGSIVTVHATASDPTVDVTICGLVEFGHQERHGDWQNDLPALGFGTSSAFQWGNNGKWDMKAYCSSKAVTHSALESATALAKKDGEMCFLVKDYATVEDASCCFCIDPPNDVFEAPVEPGKRQRRLQRRRRLGQPPQGLLTTIDDDDADDEEMTATMMFRRALQVMEDLSVGEGQFYPSPDPYAAGICPSACDRVDVPLVVSDTDAPTAAPTVSSKKKKSSKKKSKKKSRRI